MIGLTVRYRILLYRLLVAAVAAFAVGCSGDNLPAPNDPTISLSQNNLSFTAQTGSSAPAPQTVSVTSGGDGTLEGLAASVVHESGQPTGWLLASLSTSTAPSTLTLAAMPGSLPAGTYSARVEVTATGASNGPQRVNVTLTLTSPPAGAPLIVVSSASQSFTAPQGGGNPAGQSVTIENGGEGTLDQLAANISYAAGQPTGWLSASLSGTSAPSTLTLSAATGALTAGTYNASVAISAAAAGNSPQSVSVTFTIAAPTSDPLIALSSHSVGFSATRGSGNPAAKTVAVTNGGSGRLSGLRTSISYTSGQPTGWLSAGLSGNTAPSTLTLNAATGSLAAGSYTATVAVRSNAAGNSPQRVSVTFTVTAPAPTPLIALSATSKSFSATEGGANPDAQTVEVTNGGDGTLSGLSAEVSYAAGQPTGWLNAGLSGNTAPSTLTLNAATGSLAAGTYNANVAVRSSVAGNSPQTVSVTFTVTAPAPAPFITLSAASKSFSAARGGDDPEAETIEVTNSGGGTLSGLSAEVSYGAGQPTGWLTADLSADNAPSTLSLSAAIGDLEEGTYNANVAVSSGVAANSPQTVSVSFTVTAPVEESQTFLPSADNLLKHDTFNSSVGSTVFSSSELSVGSSYTYFFPGILVSHIRTASLIKFDIQSAIAGKTILEAKLTLYQHSVPGDLRGRFRLGAIAQTWNPGSITWNQWATMSTHPVGQVPFMARSSITTPLEFDVRSIVQGWADGTISNNGFQIWEPSSTAPGNSSVQAPTIQSMEVHRNATQRPQLFIRYR